VLLYGLDDLALIESTCLHYPKNQNLSFSLFSTFGGNTEALSSFSQISLNLAPFKGMSSKKDKLMAHNKMNVRFSAK
jgi:hypothetical protein